MITLLRYQQLRVPAQSLRQKRGPMVYASFANGTRHPTYLLKNMVPICAPFRPAQHGVQEWKSRTSIRSYNDASFSSLGHGRPPHLLNATDRPQHPPEPSPSSHLTPHLCYACHTTLTSRSSRGSVKQTSDSKVVPLPLWVGPSRSLACTSEDSSGEVWATHRMGDGEMEAAIGDLLLSDS